MAAVAGGIASLGTACQCGCMPPRIKSHFIKGENKTKKRREINLVYFIHIHIFYLEKPCCFGGFFLNTYAVVESFYHFLSSFSRGITQLTASKISVLFQGSLCIQTFA